MEPSQFLAFLKSLFGEKFKVFFPGVCMGFIGSKHFLWIGIPATWLDYALRGIGTVVMAFGSGLATAYAAYLVDRLKEKKSPSQKEKNTKRKRA